MTPIAGEPENIDESIEEPIFNAVADLELLQSLPLAAGYAVFVKMCNSGKDFPEQRRIRADAHRTIANRKRR